MSIEKDRLSYDEALAVLARGMAQRRDELSTLCLSVADILFLRKCGITTDEPTDVRYELDGDAVDDATGFADLRILNPNVEEDGFSNPSA